MIGALGGAGPRQEGITKVIVVAGAVVVCAVVGLLVAGPLTKASVIGLVALVALVVLLAMVARWGLAGVATASMIVAVFVAPWNGVRLPGDLALTDGFLALAAGLLVIEVAMGGRRVSAPGPVRRVLLGLVLIAAGGLIGTVVSADDVGASVDVLVRFGVAAIGTVVVVLLWDPPFAQARTAIRAWVLGASVNAAVGVFITFTITGRALGWSAHPNHLGLACMLGLAVALAELIAASSMRSRVLWLVPLALNCYGVVASGSRAALLGAGVAVALVIWRMASPAVGVFAGAVVIVGVLLVATGTLDAGSESSVGRLAGSQSARQSDASRLGLLRETIDRGSRSPFVGNGFELALQGHNIYLQLWSSAGIIGLVGFAMVVAALGRAFISAAARRATTGPATPIMVGVMAGGAAFLVSSLVQNVLWDRYLWLYFSIGLTVAVGVVSSSTPQLRSVER
jgi:hypothetical protein